MNNYTRISLACIVKEIKNSQRFFFSQKSVRLNIFSKQKFREFVYQKHKTVLKQLFNYLQIAMFLVIKMCYVTKSITLHQYTCIVEEIFQW